MKRKTTKKKPSLKRGDNIHKNSGQEDATL